MKGVLLEDLLCHDFLLRDGYEYQKAQRTNPTLLREIKKSRTGLIVDLAVTENRTRGKPRFQILGLKAKDQQELTKIVNAYQLDPPLPGVKPLEGPYNGWITPVAVKATSGHSYDVKVPLDPMRMMRQLDLKTALKLKGAYHVRSPRYLESILRNGLMPGGGQGRIVSFFRVFLFWGERNRVTRARSPLSEEMCMLVMYVLPSELTRFRPECPEQEIYYGS